MPRPQLLLTRPEPEATKTAEALADRADIVISPLMRIVPGVPADLSGAAGLILTSPSAVRVMGRLPELPCHVVGSRTAEAARAAGGRVVHVAYDAGALVAAIRGAGPAGPLLHLRGEHARGGIAERLNAAGLETREAVIYRQEATGLSSDALALLRGDRPVVVPLYSPRSAALFAAAWGDEVGAGGAPIHMVALSEAVTAAAGPPGRFASTTLAARPESAGMLTTVKARLDAVARLEAGPRGV